ncbi:4-hydroxythreonine-4-phosphate dehydrogenase PdxA [Methylophilus sp.]|uniref:4-hydroxythreonine-4-phosphate dehydrogenase PdxA n=1 Tax=Methylophilus sp. TaxID=29541 RepID=UPI000D4DDFEA|nr:4-hydroxythreonine-4-phosphate dehydrogenase PdxA [Methylophilus sp.]PPD11303.1 MAG: 4-hydroxythreonine-4-phosphate dehydrogenase PdxA [Methylophilus sp.]
MNHLPRIAITAGEPAGVGLDICVKLAHTAMPAALVVLADPQALQARASQLGLPVRITTYTENLIPHAGDGNLTVLPVATAVPVVAGALNQNNSIAVLNMLDRALSGCLAGEFDAMVTAPVHKGIINDAGIAFTGHTEYLAEKTHTEQVVMMLVGGGMRVALATTHLPLIQVSQAITASALTTTIHILHHDLVHKFGIAQPRIYVAGLNPHAGENGYLGTEEIETINPVLDQLRAEGMQLIGALPADTMFSQKNLAHADAFLAMYHDQGLSVLKHASFGEGVNVTLGLPIIRTSVDHGTALDIAGSGKADIGSMLSAIQLAIDLSESRHPKNS